MSKPETGEEVVVIGAGMGGLAAAIDLGRAGLRVTVVERQATPGGKIREVSVGDAQIDSGATVFTMKWVFDELFAAAGASFEERVGLERAEILARHAWNERERLDLYADVARTTDAIGQFAGLGAARGFEAFRSRAREIYETLEAAFIRSPRPTLFGLMRATKMTDLMRIKPFETLWRELGRYFDDQRLQQLFGRYATYCGSSPFLAPATLMLVAHVELEGVWRVTGGMQRLPEAMARLALEQGVTFRYDQSVGSVQVERGRVVAVTLDSGERLPASSIVVNADVAALAEGCFGAAVKNAVARMPTEARSLSALTLGLHTRARGFPLSRHNVFFGPDSEAEFNDVMELRRLPREPSVYVCAQDRDDSGDPAGFVGGDAPERLLLIINAPPIGDREPFEESDIETCVQRAIDLLRRCGLHVTATRDNCRVTTPADFARRFPATGGALYGRATHGAMATFQRPGARTRISGLYLAGGSVHPGPGAPMATLSGRLAAQSLLEDLPSTGRSRPAVTLGGTSMP